MLSSDREILISIKNDILALNDRVSALENTTAEIRRDVSDIKQEQIILRHDIDNLQTSVCWIFAAIGIFIAFVAVVPSLANRKTETPKDDKIHLTLSQFGALITDKFTDSQKGA